MKRYILGKRIPSLVLLALKRFLPALLVALLVLLVVRGCFVTQVAIDTPASMPGLRQGDRLLIGRTAYGLRLPLQTKNGARHLFAQTPARGEWCVAEQPSGSGKYCLVQVTALPSDTIADPTHPNRQYILPKGIYAAGNVLLHHADLVGRPLLITYSVIPHAPWHSCLRPKRFCRRLPEGNQ